MGELVTIRERLNAITKSRIGKVAILGNDVYFKSITGIERAQIMDAFRDLGEKKTIEATTRVNCKMLTMTMCDEAGTLVYGEADIDAITKWDAAVLDQFVAESQKISSLNTTSVDEARKNSEPTQSADSI